jgi:hypothetical protein
MVGDIEIKIESVREAGEGFYWLNGTTHVPPAPGNLEYKAIQKWIAAGNVPIPYTPPESEPEPEPLLRASDLADLIEAIVGLPKAMRDKVLAALKKKGTK